MEKKGGNTWPGQATKPIFGAILLGLLTLAVGGALSIPFVYESQTLWYKVGYDKTLLRGGQLAGLMAALSLFVQILLGVRGRLLEGAFGVVLLTRWHRINGLMLTLFALVHGSLVLLVEEFTGFFDLKYWPELIGAVLLSLLLAMVVTSFFRRQIGLAFTRWRLMHRMLGYLAPLLVATHIIFVSDSFTHWLPRAGLFTILAGLTVTILRIKRIPRRWGGG